jgi:hypothetical protein
MNVKVVVLFAVLAAFFLLAVAVSRAVIVHGGKPETTSTGRAPQARALGDFGVRGITAGLPENCTA